MSERFVLAREGCDPGEGDRVRYVGHPRGSAWRGRAEHYLTDPSQEPDPAKFETDVAFLTREA
jgi:hypothetical protein